MVRAFIAVDVNDNSIINKINDTIQALSELSLKIKFVETENLHITLRFLGEISEGDVLTIKENVISKLKCEPFNIVLKGLGAFPNNENPRVIWIGISEGFDFLKKLKIQIDDLLIKNGFKLSHEEFVAHLTIGRIKFGKSSALKELLEQYRNFDYGTIKVNSVKLKKSTLTRQGPIYENLVEANCK
ncbi:2''-5'' RNA ligase [Caldisphaera lagunensis DSM 15908]|uniref:RNA 2',3'-cyclic phosphodiesterase n=1 Tax=Caldisphaera lagunensis (strain DSM 15908 / JCM 11604 / ANMR 0165 / IC-154) TaxID=1056495 RepID=L0AAY9_CALLD|nr:RNA 2',3'-cyclic phosphodiesterase [Caldisphaera lagunensis]AFZ70195.1 2''-5'' RNA ligase [Caldisphaera lagunensis DSM 15908]